MHKLTPNALTLLTLVILTISQTPLFLFKKTDIGQRHDCHVTTKVNRKCTEHNDERKKYIKLSGESFFVTVQS